MTLQTLHSIVWLKTCVKCVHVRWWQHTSVLILLILKFVDDRYRETMENWQDRVITSELLSSTNMKPMTVEIERRRRKFIGHILRQDCFNDSNIALTGRPNGKRGRGRLTTTWRRMMEVVRKGAGYDWIRYDTGGENDWNTVRRAAADRVEWRRSFEALCATQARSG